MQLPSLSQWPAFGGLGSWIVGKTGVSSQPAAGSRQPGAVRCRTELLVPPWAFSKETSLAGPSLKQPDPRLWTSETPRLWLKEHFCFETE